MIVDFKALDKNSRVWIFQSINMMEQGVIEKIKEKTTLFLNEWKSHQKEFNSSFEIIFLMYVDVLGNENLAFPTVGMTGNQQKYGSWHIETFYFWMYSYPKWWELGVLHFPTPKPRF